MHIIIDIYEILFLKLLNDKPMLHTWPVMLALNKLKLTKMTKDAKGLNLRGSKL